MSRTSQIEMWMPPTREDADRAEVDVDRRHARRVRTGEVRRREPRRAVCADGEERDVAEVEQPRVAHDHVQPERHHHVHGTIATIVSMRREVAKIGTLEQCQFSLA